MHVHLFLTLRHYMRGFIALFFLLVFSFQVLPLKALGKLLARAQMTEEVKHSCEKDDCGGDDTGDDGFGGCDDDDDAGKDSKEGKDDTIEKYNDIIHHHHSVFRIFTGGASHTGLTHPADEDVLHLFIKDIHCPPPNCQ